MKTSKKARFILVAAILLIVVTFGSTIAYLLDSTRPVVNEFDPATVTTEIVEDFDGKVKKDVKVKNTGTTDAYIRAAVVVTWQDANGNVFGAKPVAGTDYTVSFANDGWDVDTTDGFYYYTLPVAPNASTGVLISEIKPVAGKAPEGYTLCVEILSEAIQAEPAKVVVDNWGVTVDEDGKISK